MQAQREGRRQCASIARAKGVVGDERIIPNMSGPVVPPAVSERRVQTRRCRGKGPRIQAQTATDELTTGVRDRRWGRCRIEWAASSRTLPVCDAPDAVRRVERSGDDCATLTR